MILSNVYSQYLRYQFPRSACCRSATLDVLSSRVTKDSASNIPRISVLGPYEAGSNARRERNRCLPDGDDDDGASSHSRRQEQWPSRWAVHTIILRLVQFGDALKMFFGRIGQPRPGEIVQRIIMRVHVDKGSLACKAD